MKLNDTPGVALGAAVQPKNDDDALLIDNLFRAMLGGDSIAIDTARMALRQRMNELRNAGVKGCRRCDGDGSLLNHPSMIEPTRKCPDCKGTGTVGVTGTGHQTFSQQTPLVSGDSEANKEKG